MHTDPNALLSTLSQSSAVMVAIIGGFLVSKLVAISSEREALKRQLKSTRQRLKHIQPAYDDAYRYRLENSRATFSDWISDDLVEAGLNEVDYQALTAEHIPRGSSLEEMLPYAIDLHERVKKAYDKISPMLKGEYSDSSLGLDDLKSRGLKITEADESIFEDVFYKLKSQLPEQPTTNFMGILSKMPNLASTMSLGAIRPAWSHEIDARRLDESIHEEQNLKEQLVAIESDISRLTYDLAKLGRPVGVLPAVWILALLSVVGIVLPVIVMAFEPTELNIALKLILIGSFIIGLFTVLGYIVWYLKKINH